MNEISLYELYINDMIRRYKSKYPYSYEIKNKIKHIINCGNIARKISKDDDMLYIGALYHDIGRFIQYDQIKTFNDNIVSHCIDGKDYFNMEVASGKIPNTNWNDYIISAIRWHETGLPELTNIDIILSDFVNTIRDIDMIENGCVSVVSYLEKEIKDDAKGYIKSNPTINMKYIRPRYIELYRNFEPMTKDCITYAEYILFAAHITIQAVLKYDLTELINENNILEWYKNMFNKYMLLNDSFIAYEKLKEVLE